MEKYCLLIRRKHATLYYQGKNVSYLAVGRRVGNLFEMQYHQISRNKDHVEESSDVNKDGIRFEEEKHQKNIR